MAPRNGGGSNRRSCRLSKRGVSSQVTGNSIPPIVLRNGISVEDPLKIVIDSLEAQPGLDVGVASRLASFGETDLRLANRGGARISAAEIANILERRRRIERALRAIAPDASLAGAERDVPWLPLGQLFNAFADIRGVGFAKATKALHPKRPALIPMLDSVVQKYLRDDDLGAESAYGERALGFVRGYKRDLDANRRALKALRRELARHNRAATEVRILDLLIWSVETAA